MFVWHNKLLFVHSITKIYNFSTNVKNVEPSLPKFAQNVDKSKLLAVPVTPPAPQILHHWHKVNGVLETQLVEFLSCMKCMSRSRTLCRLDCAMRPEILHEISRYSMAEKTDRLNVKLPVMSCPKQKSKIALSRNIMR